MPTPNQKSNVNSQSFKFYAKGLKPSTLHYFFFDGVDFTNHCWPIIPFVPTPSVQFLLNSYHGPLITDPSGNLNFGFYFNPAGFTSTSDYAYIQYYLNTYASTKVAVIKTMDETSMASYTLTVKPGF